MNKHIKNYIKSQNKVLAKINKNLDKCTNLKEKKYLVMVKTIIETNIKAIKSMELKNVNVQFS